ncbi:MAG: hypothetical protein GX275_08140 [Clostridiales bacterium]|nr:hypothetical protein [Clostridiales bacterium]
MRKHKRLIIFLSTILILALGVYIGIELISWTEENGFKAVTKEDNEITYSIGGYRYIHMKFWSSSRGKSVNYKILNSKNEVVSTGTLHGEEVEYIGDCSKGKWKIVFDVEDYLGVDYTVWSGNLKSRDQIE